MSNAPLRTLLVGTHNAGKVSEYRELLYDLDAAWVGLGDVGMAWEVEESGETFKENAILKATRYAEASGLLTLADDSGLEVEALDGQPGVRTARFGGEGLNAIERYLLLLDKLRGVPVEKRDARFRCVVALADKAGLIATASGIVEGRIAMAPSGNEGFGYDPVFYVPEQRLTMAQLPVAVKNQMSHRARALAALRPRLEAALRER
jgi:XTP/dITP diphosphohydrolase